MEDINKYKCPLCNHILYQKHEGMVCKNWNCKLYFKNGKGWVCLDKEKRNSHLFFTSKYDFDIINYENRRAWLKLKSKKLYEKNSCEICNSKIYLHIHHILPRSSFPELSFSIENLMVLCENCHKEIHKGDKYKFS